METSNWYFRPVEGVELHIHSRKHYPCTRWLHTAVAGITITGNLNSIAEPITISVCLVGVGSQQQFLVVAETIRITISDNNCDGGLNADSSSD